jgi:hypothetical protein
VARDDCRWHVAGGAQPRRRNNHIDTTSLFLVGFILLCPWLTALKRIKIGDFKAELIPPK